MVMQTCVECEGKIEFAEPPRLSEIAECPECACVLEVVSVDPLILALAPAVEEDWGE